MNFGIDLNDVECLFVMRPPTRLPQKPDGTVWMSYDEAVSLRDSLSKSIAEADRKWPRERRSRPQKPA
jgi:hypothetical protein